MVINSETSWLTLSCPAVISGPEAVELEDVVPVFPMFESRLDRLELDVEDVVIGGSRL
jgi:hypothetical protein